MHDTSDINSLDEYVRLFKVSEGSRVYQNDRDFLDFVFFGEMSKQEKILQHAFTVNNPKTDLFKMSRGEIFPILTLKLSQKARITKTENFTEPEFNAIIDEIVCCLCCWLTGGSFECTILNCLYIQKVDILKDEFLKEVVLTLLSIVSVISSNLVGYGQVGNSTISSSSMVGSEFFPVLEDPEKISFKSQEKYPRSRVLFLLYKFFHLVNKIGADLEKGNGLNKVVDLVGAILLELESNRSTLGKSDPEEQYKTVCDHYTCGGFSLYGKYFYVYKNYFRESMIPPRERAYALLAKNLMLLKKKLSLVSKIVFDSLKENLLYGNVLEYEFEDFNISHFDDKKKYNPEMMTLLFFVFKQLFVKKLDKILSVEMVQKLHLKESYVHVISNCTELPEKYSKSHAYPVKKVVFSNDPAISTLKVIHRDKTQKEWKFVEKTRVFFNSLKVDYMIRFFEQLIKLRMLSQFEYLPIIKLLLHLNMKKLNQITTTKKFLSTSDLPSYSELMKKTKSTARCSALLIKLKFLLATHLALLKLNGGKKLTKVQQHTVKKRINVFKGELFDSFDKKSFKKGKTINYLMGREKNFSAQSIDGQEILALYSEVAAMAEAEKNERVKKVCENNMSFMGSEKNDYKIKVLKNDVFISFS